MPLEKLRIYFFLLFVCSVLLDKADFKKYNSKAVERNGV